MIRLTLDIGPSANRYWRVGNNRVYRSEEAVNYCAYVGLLCNTAGITPLDGDVAVTLRVYRGAKRGDLDNYQKVVLDAMQGHCYDNDSQIVVIDARRFDDKANPRIEIEVRAA